MTIAVDSFYEIKPPIEVWIAYYITMCIQLVNIVICFLKVRDKNSEPTLKTTAITYMK